MSFREVDVAEMMEMLPTANLSLSAENERLRDRLRSLEGRAVYNHNHLEYLRHLSQEEPLIRLEYDLFKIDCFPSNPSS